MKRTSRFDEACTDCLWHANEIVILSEWLHESLKNRLASADDAADINAAYALKAELLTVRDSLKTAFRGFTRIEVERLDKLLAVESCRNDDVARARLNRLEVERNPTRPAKST